MFRYIGDVSMGFSLTDSGMKCSSAVIGAWWRAWVSPSRFSSYWTSV